MRTWIEISQKAILRNARQFKKILTPKTLFLAVLKSNAYGHGLTEVGKCLKKKVDWFGVDSFEEALTLKRVTTKPILILGYMPLDALEHAARMSNIRFTVYNPETIRVLGAIAKKLQRQIHVHLKVETGASRQGVLSANLLETAKLINNQPFLKLEGLSSHLANVEDALDHSYTAFQLERFKQAVETLSRAGFKIPIKHLASSAATILFPQTYFNMVRVGIGLYGLWPSEIIHRAAMKQEKLKNFKLLPALAWKTTIAQIKSVARGAPIGYGLTERARRRTRLAVLPIGYWDGFDRKLSSCGAALIRGKRAKVLGRVCMNMCMVDVTSVKEVKLEDEAVLIGKQGREKITADEIAQKIKTINYEVTTRINPFLPRVVV